MPVPTWTSPFGSSAPPSGAFQFAPTWPSPDVASSLPQWPDTHGNGGYVGQIQESTTPNDSYDQLSYYSPSTVATSSADTSSYHHFTSVALAPASQPYVSNDLYPSAQPWGNNVSHPVTSTQGHVSQPVPHFATRNLTVLVSYLIQDLEDPTGPLHNGNLVLQDIPAWANVDYSTPAVYDTSLEWRVSCARIVQAIANYELRISYDHCVYLTRTAPFVDPVISSNPGSAPAGTQRFYLVGDVTAVLEPGVDHMAHAYRLNVPGPIVLGVQVTLKLPGQQCTQHFQNQNPQQSFPLSNEATNSAALQCFPSSSTISNDSTPNSYYDSTTEPDPLSQSYVVPSNAPALRYNANAVPILPATSQNYSLSGWTGVLPQNTHFSDSTFNAQSPMPPPVPVPQNNARNAPPKATKRTKSGSSTSPKQQRNQAARPSQQPNGSASNSYYDTTTAPPLSQPVFVPSNAPPLRYNTNAAPIPPVTLRSHTSSGQADIGTDHTHLPDSTVDAQSHVPPPMPVPENSARNTQPKATKHTKSGSSAAPKQQRDQAARPSQQPGGRNEIVPTQLRLSHNQLTADSTAGPSSSQGQRRGAVVPANGNSTLQRSNTITTQSSGSLQDSRASLSSTAPILPKKGRKPKATIGAHGSTPVASSPMWVRPPPSQAVVVHKPIEIIDLVSPEPVISARATMNSADTHPRPSTSAPSPATIAPPPPPPATKPSRTLSVEAKQAEVRGQRLAFDGVAMYRRSWYPDDVVHVSTPVSALEPNPKPSAEGKGKRTYAKRSAKKTKDVDETPEEAATEAAGKRQAKAKKTKATTSTTEPTSNSPPKEKPQPKPRFRKSTAPATETPSTSAGPSSATSTAQSSQDVTPSPTPTLPSLPSAHATVPATKPTPYINEHGLALPGPPTRHMSAVIPPGGLYLPGMPAPLPSPIRPAKRGREEEEEVSAKKMKLGDVQVEGKGEGEGEGEEEDNDSLFGGGDDSDDTGGDAGDDEEQEA